jgi:hypothetical protein
MAEMDNSCNTTTEKLLGRFQKKKKKSLKFKNVLHNFFNALGTIWNETLFAKT